MKSRRTFAGLALAVSFPSVAAGTTVVAQWNMDDTFGTTMEDSWQREQWNDIQHRYLGSGLLLRWRDVESDLQDLPTLNPGSADFSFSVQVQTSVVPPSDKDYDLMRKGNVGTKGGEV